MKRKNQEVSVEERRHIAIADIYRKLHSVPARKDRTNESLEALQQFTDAGGSVFQAKMRNRALALNQAVYKSCEEEAEYLRKLLFDIEKMKQIEYKGKSKSPIKRHTLMQLLIDQGLYLPLYVGGLDGFPPPSVGAIELPPGAPLKQGDAVAALVDDNWILAEVQTALCGGKFEIHDVDDDQKNKVILGRSCLIPLPKMRADPTRDGHALFPKDAIVLALYPQTTCFYRGIVQRQPETATDTYLIMFEDASYTNGYSPALPVHQRYVVSFRNPPL